MRRCRGRRRSSASAGSRRCCWRHRNINWREVADGYDAHHNSLPLQGMRSPRRRRHHSSGRRSPLRARPHPGAPSLAGEVDASSWRASSWRWVRSQDARSGGASAPVHSARQLRARPGAHSSRRKPLFPHREG